MRWCGVPECARLRLQTWKDCIRQRDRLALDVVDRCDQCREKRMLPRRFEDDMAASNPTWAAAECVAFVYACETLPCVVYMCVIYTLHAIHCVICSTLSAEATTTMLWHAGIHIHVVDDTLHKFVVNQRIYVYVCTATPLMESFLRGIHYHNYACAILYDSTSTISRQRCPIGYAC